MASSGAAQWHSADEFLENPRVGSETIRDNFSRILDGPGLPAYGAAGWKAEPVVIRRSPRFSVFADSFPRMFTCVCCLVFFTPIFLMVRIGRDTNVRYWLGPWCDIAAFLPCLFILGHIVHSSRGRPHKPTVLLCLLVPAITLLVLGEFVLTAVADRANQLFSTDCDTFPEKRALESQHVAAEGVFATCLADTVSSGRGGDLTLEHAAELYRIQDCEEYESELQTRQRDWTYLRHMEEEHRCAGWCSVGQPVWTFGEVRDSCSVAASTIFDGKIRHMASQVTVYTIVVLFITSIALLFVGDPLRQAGIDW